MPNIILWPNFLFNNNYQNLPDFFPLVWEFFFVWKFVCLKFFSANILFPLYNFFLPKYCSYKLLQVTTEKKPVYWKLYFNELSGTLLQRIQANTGYLTLLQVTSGYYRLLHVSIDYFMLLKVTTGYYRVLQVTMGYFSRLK